jgi:hypothetical protein
MFRVDREKGVLSWRRCIKPAAITARRERCKWQAQAELHNWLKGICVENRDLVEPFAAVFSNS